MVLGQVKVIKPDVTYKKKDRDAPDHSVSLVCEETEPSRDTISVLP